MFDVSCSKCELAPFAILIDKVVLYPKNRIFCVPGRFFETVTNRLFNHSFALFLGVFDQKKSFVREICKKLIICLIFGHSNAPNNDCLRFLVQNFDETILPLRPLSRDNGCLPFVRKIRLV